MENRNRQQEWYDSPDAITNITIVMLILILLQITSLPYTDSVMDALRTFLGLSVSYILFLVYFVLLKFQFGKRYFNLLNVGMSFIYVLIFIGSFFNLIQDFNFSNVVFFIQTIFVFLYFVKTFFEDMKVWESLKLNKLHLDKIKNIQYFIIILLITILWLGIVLFQVRDFSVLLSCFLKGGFIVCFSRYIYLYQDYKEMKQKIKQAMEDVELERENEIRRREKVVSKLNDNTKKKEGK